MANILINTACCSAACGAVTDPCLCPGQPGVYVYLESACSAYQNLCGTQAFTGPQRWFATYEQTCNLNYSNTSYGGAEDLVQVAIQAENSTTYYKSQSTDEHYVDENCDIVGSCGETTYTHTGTIYIYWFEQYISGSTFTRIVNATCTTYPPDPAQSECTGTETRTYVYSDGSSDTTTLDWPCFTCLTSLVCSNSDPTTTVTTDTTQTITSSIGSVERVLSDEITCDAESGLQVEAAICKSENWDPMPINQGYEIAPRIEGDPESTFTPTCINLVVETDIEGCIYCVNRGNISWVLPPPESGSVEVTLCQTEIQQPPILPCEDGGTTYTLTYSEDSTDIILEDLSTGFIFELGDHIAQICVLDAVYIAAP